MSDRGADGVLLEVCTYQLRAGVGADFHRLNGRTRGAAADRARDPGVRCGPSEVEDEETANSYLLIRALDSVAQRIEQEDRFYGSAGGARRPVQTWSPVSRATTPSCCGAHSTAVDALSDPPDTRRGSNIMEKPSTIAGCLSAVSRGEGGPHAGR